MPETMMEGLRDYFLACPQLKDGKLNINFLPDGEQGTEYSIDTIPGGQVLKTYINGDSQRQLLFAIRSVEEYGSDVLANLDSCGLFERLESWMERQSSAGVLPALPEGKQAERVEVQSTCYLMSTTPNYGKYQIQCRLIYRQRKE